MEIFYQPKLPKSKGEKVPFIHPGFQPKWSWIPPYGTNRIFLTGLFWTRPADPVFFWSSCLIVWPTVGFVPRRGVFLTSPSQCAPGYPCLQIRGVDIEETACRIACFSLYLAYLDFFNPPDIQKYMERTGQPLPKLLDYGDIPDRPPADIPVILKADFLEKTLYGETFNCIIGNPPWEGRQSKLSAQKYIQKAPFYSRKKEPVLPAAHENSSKPDRRFSR